MSNLTVQKLGAEAQLDNDPHRLDYIRRDQGRLDPALTDPKRDWRELAALGLIIVPGWLIVTIAIWVVHAIIRWGAPRELWTGDVWVAYFAAMASTFLPIVAAVVWMAVLTWQKLLRARVEAARARITRDRYSNPIDVLAVLQKTPEQLGAELMLATRAEIAMAPHKWLPAGVDAVHIGGSPAVQSAQEAAGGEKVDIGPLPPEEWMAWLDKQPHPMLAAETGAGKSTLAKALLARRIDADEDVFVIDPHSSEWFDLPSVGGGENWPTIGMAMRAVTAEYHSRLAEREEAKKTTGRELPKNHFKRLTVLMDEGNAIKAFWDAASASKKNNLWTTFIQALGSGARKVNISIVMLVQSANVEDLGISGAMRENFAVISLDSRCIGYQIDQNEKLYPRRQAIYETVAGRQWPATTVMDGKVWVLSREGIMDIGPRRDSTKAAWAGWDYVNNVPVRVCVRAEEGQNGSSGAGLAANERTNGTEGLSKAQKIEWLRLLRSQGMTRDEARKLFGGQGIGFTDTDWTEAGR